MLGIAGCVHTVLRVEDIGRVFLGLSAHNEAVALLGVYVIYEALLALEVICYAIRLIRRFTILEHRQTDFEAKGIDAACRMDYAAVHIHLYDLGCEFYFVVIDLAFTIEECIAAT